MVNPRCTSGGSSLFHWIPKRSTLAKSDEYFVALAQLKIKTTNGFLAPRSLPHECIFTLHHHHAQHCSSSLYKNLKTLLLSLAVSDIGVGLLAQPSYVVRLIMVYVVRLVMESKQSNVTDTNYIVIYTSFFNDKFICFRLPRC